LRPFFGAERFYPPNKIVSAGLDNLGIDYSVADLAKPEVADRFYASVMISFDRIMRWRNGLMTCVVTDGLMACVVTDGLMACSVIGVLLS
jgi:hypothetical protein